LESVATTVPHDVVGTELLRDWIPDGDPRAVIVLVHGHAEHSGRYERPGSILSDAGFRVRAFDLIGAGATGGPRWDTDDWEVFHDQLQRHIEWARTEGAPVILMGHSTGGSIALGYSLEDRPRPDMLILSTPLIELRRTWQTTMAPILAKVAPKMWVPAPTKLEDLSRDEAVGEAYDADPLVVKGGTVRFGVALLDEMKRIRANWHDLDIPTYVFHGGLDVLVPPQSTAPMAELATVERKLYPSLRHETMNEPEGPEVVADVIDWINKRL
jgi:alpha-beta hydrolase superfamily lysophospholipase